MNLQNFVYYLRVKLMRNDSGQDLLEYALLVALIALVCVVRLARWCAWVASRRPVLVCSRSSAPSAPSSPRRTPSEPSGKGVVRAGIGPPSPREGVVRTEWKDATWLSA